MVICAVRSLRTVCSLGSLWTGLAVGLTGVAAPIRGELPLPALTAAAPLPGGRLLLAGRHGLQVTVLEDAASRLRSGRVLPAESESVASALQGKVAVDDLQDAASDGAGNAYLVASHARSPDGDAPEEHFRMLRLRFSAAGRLAEARQSDALLRAIQSDVPFLADAMRRPPARAGLNIGGLAWDGPAGELVVGLRSPTVTESRPRPGGGQEDAVVLRIRNSEGLFAEPPQPARLADVVKINLRGEGIHGMCYDPDRRGFWIVSGLSVALGHPVQCPWALWFWDGTRAPREVPVPAGTELEQPAAVCRLEVEGRPRLLLLDGGPSTSRYALIPVPDPPVPAP